jgi:hypothetical protein
MPRISFQRDAIDLETVWSALGGGELRGRRGRAFWRGGTHDSVALDLSRKLWFDHAAGEGGDVVALVQRVVGCDFRGAVAWLSDFAGAPAPNSGPARDHGVAAGWHADLKWACRWALTARALADQLLAQLEPCDPQREALVALLRTLRLGDAALVAEYREWRLHEPVLTRALARAGQRAEVRMQQKLIAFLKELMRGETASRASRTCSFDSCLD